MQAPPSVSAGVLIANPRSGNNTFVPRGVRLSPILLFACIVGCGDIPPRVLPTPVFFVEVTSSIPPGEPGAPAFRRVAAYTDRLPATERAVDLYWPIEDAAAPADSPAAPFPLIVLMTGATVERPHYRTYCRMLATYGFVVAVPQGGDVAGVGPFVDTIDARAAIDFVRAATADAASPIAGLADASRVAMVGHSFGGESVLLAAADRCHPLYCSAGPARPAELVGVVSYGADLRHIEPDRGIQPIENDGIPIAVIRGTLDAIDDPRDAAATFAQIQAPPAALITVKGANHFAFTDSDALSLIVPEPKPSEQFFPATGEAIARWTALFLRAFAYHDPAALAYVTDIGPAAETNIDVELLD